MRANVALGRGHDEHARAGASRLCSAARQGCIVQEADRHGGTYLDARSTPNQIIMSAHPLTTHF